MNLMQIFGEPKIEDEKTPTAHHLQIQQFYIHCIMKLYHEPNTLEHHSF